MNQHNKITLLIFICMVALATGCKWFAKDEPNPCAGKQPTTAEFKIYELYYTDSQRKSNYEGFYGWVNYDTDTILASVVPYLEATQDSSDGTTYEWTIGDTKVYKKAFYIQFHNRPKGQNNIPIKLKVTTRTNKECFPEDSGVATSVRTLVLLDTSTFYTINGILYSNCGGLDCRARVQSQSLVQGTFVGEYFDHEDGGKKYENDTLIVQLNKDISLGTIWQPGFAYNSYSHSFIKRKGVEYFVKTYRSQREYFPWRILNIYDTQIGYRQICMIRNDLSTQMMLNNNRITVNDHRNRTIFNGIKL